MAKFGEHRNHRFTQANLSAYLDGELSERDAARVQAHLARCQACRQEMADLQATIRALSALPRAPLPRSFTLGPEAVQGQQRAYRLERGIAVLRTAGVALAMIFLLLISGDQLLARGVISLPAESRAALEPSQRLGQEQADLEDERQAQGQAARAEAAVEVFAAQGNESEAEQESPPEAFLAMAVPEETAEPAPDDRQGEAVRPEESLVWTAEAQGLEEQASPPPTETLSFTPTPEPTGATPTHEVTGPALGVASATAAAELASAPTRNDDRFTATLPAEREVPRQGTLHVIEEQGAEAFAPGTETPTLSPTLTPTLTATPLPPTSVPATSTPEPTHQEPTRAPTLPAEVLDLPPTATPEQEALAAEALPLEEEVMLLELEAPSEPETDEAAQEAAVLEAMDEPEPAPALEASKATQTETLADPVVTARTIVRRAAVAAAGLGLVVLGGLLWLSHQRRL